MLNHDVFVCRGAEAFRNCRACGCYVSRGALYCEDCYRHILESWDYEGSGAGIIASHGKYYYPTNTEDYSDTTPRRCQQGKGRGRTLTEEQRRKISESVKRTKGRAEE